MIYIIYLLLILLDRCKTANNQIFRIKKHRSCCEQKYFKIADMYNVHDDVHRE